MVHTKASILLLLSCFFHGFSSSSSETPSLSLTYNGGKIITEPVTISLLWFGAGWQESDKETVRDAINSLTSTRYDLDLSYNVPTLGNWWDVIRQYRDSSNSPVTDKVNLGPECSYTGPHVNMTLNQVSEIGRSAFNRTSIDGFGKNLTCSEIFLVDENSIYPVLFSDTVTFFDDGTKQRELIDMCSGSFPIVVSNDQAVSMVWARAPMEAGDQCSVLLHGNLYRAPPNGNEKVDGLVGNLLGKIAEEVTNQDGRGWTSSDRNGLTVISLCTSQFERRSTSPPLYTDINGNFSFNVIGLNGHKYIVPYTWDQNIRNCALNLSGSNMTPAAVLEMFPSSLLACLKITVSRFSAAEACPSDLVILKQHSSSLQMGIGVNHSDGLQPYFRNQQCKWKIEIPEAKFIVFHVNYFSVAPDSDDFIQVCPLHLSHGDDYNRITIMDKDLLTDFKLDWLGGLCEVRFCSGKEDIHDTYGIIGYGTSDGAPYVHGLNCRWVLHSTPGTAVSLTFTRINISKDLDFVAIFSSTSQQIANFTGSYGSLNLPRINLTGKVTITFDTQTDEGDGWSANYHLSSPEKPSKRTILFVLVVVFMVIAVCFSVGIVVLALLRRRRREKTPMSMDPNEGHLFVRNEFLREENRIGEGPSAAVYRAVFPDGSLVAVKCYKDAESPMALEEEILLKSSTHPNIVSFLGSSRERFPTRYLVFEFMARGSLSYNLREKGETLNWEQRLEIGLQVSSAIQMLHMYMKPSVFHGNIVSDNVLLDELCNAKLGGFGSARYCNANNWMDKEELLETAEDMWSFGVLLLELLAGEPVTNRNDYRNFRSFREINEIMGDREFLDRRLGLPSDDCKVVALAKFGDIAKWCVSGSLRVEGNDENPKIGDVLSGLQQVKELFHSVPRYASSSCQ